MATRWRWPPGKLGRLALQQRRELQHGGGGVDLAFDDGFGHAQVFQAEGHVVVDAHVRVQRIGLEHHGAAAVRGADLVDALAVDADIAAAGGLQPRDDAQQRGFATARRADKDHKFTVRDGQVHAMDDGGFVEGFDDVGEFKSGHGESSVYLTPALAMPVAMYFCRKAKTRVIGISVITVIASR